MKYQACFYTMEAGSYHSTGYFVKNENNKVRTYKYFELVSCFEMNNREGGNIYYEDSEFKEIKVIFEFDNFEDITKEFLLENYPEHCL